MEAIDFTKFSIFSSSFLADEFVSDLFEHELTQLSVKIRHIIKE